jgi:SAM-dependent methyltransferase
MSGRPGRGVIRWLRERLAEPRVLEIDIDGTRRIVAHREVLLAKSGLRRLLRDVYALCVALDVRHFSGVGPRVEVGAGSSLFKESSREIISTDIQAARHLDLVADALRLPFRAASIHAVYGIEFFHHLRDPEVFFDELRRILKPGGGCVLIEPYYGLVASQLYRHLFDSEFFDPGQIGWRAPAIGPMRGANQALSYIVFVRDRATFRTKYPDLRIVQSFPLNNYLRYLGSGGVNFRSVLPDALVPLARLAETALIPVNRIVALHHAIVLRYEPHLPGTGEREVPSKSWSA